MITTKNILPITTVKKNLMALVKQIESSSDPVVITKDGKAAAVIFNAEEYESLMETLEILSDKDLVKSLKKAQGEFQKGQSFSHEQVFKES